MRIKVLSLVDVTKTGLHKNNSNNEKAIAQHANYLTFENCLQLRTNIVPGDAPKVEKINLANTNFGKNYSGNHNVWSMEFAIEDRADPLPVNEIIDFIKEDIDLVPIINSLDETIGLTNSMFRTLDPETNNIIVVETNNTVDNDGNLDNK